MFKSILSYIFPEFYPFSCEYRSVFNRQFEYLFTYLVINWRFVKDNLRQAQTPQPKTIFYLCQFGWKFLWCKDKTHSKINPFQLTFECAYLTMVCAGCGLQLLVSPKCDNDEFARVFLNCMVWNVSKEFLNFILKV